MPLGAPSWSTTGESRNVGTLMIGIGFGDIVYSSGPEVILAGLGDGIWLGLGGIVCTLLSNTTAFEGIVYSRIQGP